MRNTGFDGQMGEKANLEFLQALTVGFIVGIIHRLSKKGKL